MNPKTLFALRPALPPFGKSLRPLPREIWLSLSVPPFYIHPCRTRSRGRPVSCSLTHKSSCVYLACFYAIYYCSRSFCRSRGVITLSTVFQNHCPAVLNRPEREFSSPCRPLYQLIQIPRHFFCLLLLSLPRRAYAFPEDAASPLHSFALSHLGYYTLNRLVLGSAASTHKLKHTSHLYLTPSLFVHR